MRFAFRVRHRYRLIVCLSCVVAACAQPDRLGSDGSRAWAQPASGGGTDGHRPHAGMLRYPDVSATHIAFVYANDVWLVPREGGLAVPLASPPGPESFPRFSPDGDSIAFVGNYDGNRDLYTVPVSGGVPARVTHHPARETLCDWTTGGELLFYFNGLAPLRRQAQLFTVSPDGGLPKRLPVPYGANGAISPDGRWLAYTPHSRDSRTWKRYRGGMATDIWLFNLSDHTSRKATDWEGTDSQPMWHGDKLYYISDAGPAHRLNIWSFDPGSGARAQLTKFTDFDIKWPAVGPGASGGGEIVFQNGASLYLLDLSNGESNDVAVQIPGARPKIRTHTADVSESVRAWDISSTGKRAVFEARGDIWTVPAKNGAPRNLTRTSGAAERDPSWSPDGQWIAYFGDASGEYELYIAQSDGKGDTRRLTKDGAVYRYSPIWSPDSKKITFTDKTGAIYLHDIEGVDTKLVDTEPWATPTTVSWSNDSRWITYVKGGDNRVGSIWLYELESGAKHHVTSGMFNDSSPIFDRKGDYLFFASSRNFTTPMYEDLGTTFIYAGTQVLLAVPLRAEVGSPWAPKSDEEDWKDAEDEDEDDEKDGGAGDDNDAKSGKGDDAGGEQDDADSAKADKEDGAKGKADDGDHAEDDANGDDDEEEDEAKPVEPIVIEIDGFEQRAILVPVKAGNFDGLSVNHEGKLVYVRVGSRGSGIENALKLFDLDDEKKEEKTVVSGVSGYAMSADGKKLVVRKGKVLAIVDAAPDQKLDEPLKLKGMKVAIDPRAEWRQLFNEAWRVERDFFYDPNMHGVDWNAMRERYGRMIEDCASREDVTFVIGELIAELNVGHAYARGGGDIEDQPRESVGMLGVDFALENGAYRIAKVYRGAPWDSDARGPLGEPGLDAKEGDYVLAVNGAPLDAAQSPWAAFQGLAGEVVTVTVSDKPTLDDEAREIVVEPSGNEVALRYRAWVEMNRAYVASKTYGRVGYIHVPDTGVNGQNELFRQFFGQVDRGALIVDERWNGGGQIPTRFIELLNRPMANYWARRDGHDWPWPPDSQQGPKCMLINGLAGSGGDYFPFYFRDRGLGKLIGMRTWGGLVGYSGNPQLIDGGNITAPTFAFYEMDGTWGIEGHGVDPDIEVVDDPALMVDGTDPQLDRAIEQMLAELKSHPYRPPTRPAYPDRSGMGVLEADK